MRTIVIALCALSLLSSASGFASEYEDRVEKTFRPAIVKIDVSTNTPVFDNGINICKSEGTGFLVSSSYVATAEHVYTLSPECGKPTILIKSAAFNIQTIGTVVDAKDDVALLKIDGVLPTGMCVLGLQINDVFDTDAVRFGIPGGFEEPGPAAGVRIGPRANQFAPMVLMSPVVAEKGESGGPVIHVFNVVGMTRAKHMKYPAFSFMTVGSAIRALMTKNSVRQSGHICNPVEENMFTKFNGGDGTGGFLNEFSKTGYAVSKQSTGTVFGNVTMTGQFTHKEASIAGDLFSSFSKKFGDTLKLTSSDEGQNVSLEANIKTLDEHNEAARKVARATNEFSQQLREGLWNEYIADARKSGKFKQ
jgi:hypothetical protein